MKFHLLSLIVFIFGLGFAKAESSTHKIENFVELNGYDLACAVKIAGKIEELDSSMENHQLVGPGASMNIDKVTPTKMTGVKKISVTINEADYMDGYSIFSALVKGKGADCVVKSVKWLDSAL